jgi:hypothetical protein
LLDPFKSDQVPSNLDSIEKIERMEDGLLKAAKLKNWPQPALKIQDMKKVVRTCEDLRIDSRIPSCAKLERPDSW